MNPFKTGDRVQLRSERRFYSARIPAGSFGTVVGISNVPHATMNGGGYDTTIRFDERLREEAREQHARAMRNLGLNNEYIETHANDVICRSTELFVIHEHDERLGGVELIEHLFYRHPQSATAFDHDDDHGGR